MSVQPLGNAGFASQLTPVPPPGQAPGQAPAAPPQAGPATQTPPSRATTHEAASRKPEASTPDNNLEQALKKLNDFVNTASRDLTFSVDKDTDIAVVKVVDRQTQEVIRQIPSEEVIQIAKVLDKLQGLLVRDKA